MESSEEEVRNFEGLLRLDFGKKYKARKITSDSRRRHTAQSN